MCVLLTDGIGSAGVDGMAIINTLVISKYVFKLVDD